MPTYGLVSEYFGVQELRLGVDAEGRLMRFVGILQGVTLQASEFGFGVWAEHPRGVWSIGFLAMN